VIPQKIELVVKKATKKAVKSKFSIDKQRRQGYFLSDVME